jgi:metallo-beta-lactamase family protein
MKLTVWGAAKQVTGSMHMLQVGNKTLLVDCGLDYEKKSDGLDHNANFPFNPGEIDAMILTHAHIDHSGNIPNLIKQGFDGPIFMTHPTAILSEFLLQDSLNIQRMEASKQKRKSRNRRRTKKFVQDGELLYGKKHIKRMLGQMVILPFKKEVQILPGFALSFYDAGHIFGQCTPSCGA